MKHFIIPLQTVLLLLLVLAGAVYLVWNAQGQNKAAAYADTDPAYNKTYWLSEFKKQGQKKILQDFKKRNAQAPEGRQHFAAHVLGGVFAESLGVNGITACDASFDFGCYHGFFAQIIASGGTALVRSLDEVCVATYGPFGTGCQHGIGHGILEYVGYEKINDALALCKDTTQKVPLLGCTSGVFMEYNTPLGGPDTGLVPKKREFDPKNPYQPCTGVAKEFKASCYFELGHWVYVSVGQDAKTVAGFCGGLTGEDRRHCFLGVGDIVTPLNAYSLDKALAFCASFEASDQLACRAGVSWSMFATPGHESESVAACAYDTDTDSKACETMADLTEGQARK